MIHLGVNRMKPIVKELIRVAVVGCVLPCVLIGFVIRATQPERPEQTVPTIMDSLQTQPQTIPTTQPQPTLPAKIEPQTVPVLIDETPVVMELEGYIIGVVLGEMPASFEMEALKAQAIVARTYTLKTCLDGKRHPGGAICTESVCCQAYCPPQDYLAKGGTEDGLRRVISAVEDTCGQVLTYDGTLITATYFSCSGGSTEDAVAVWGYDIPYLQSVSSPGEENSSAFYRETRFTPGQLCKKLGLSLTGDPADWFGPVSYTSGGGVAAMEIGGESFRGTAIRTRLGLRSTMFSVRVEDGAIIFCTRGYGHRVGMSQYGANAMAQAGYSCSQILLHYYTDTVLTTFFGKIQEKL